MKFASYINALLLKSHLISLNQNQPEVTNPLNIQLPLFQKAKHPQLTHNLSSA